MVAPLDIPLRRNEDWSTTLTLSTLSDTGSAPIDLTDMTVAMQVRERVSQSLVTEAEVTITDATAGEVTLVLRGSEGSALAAYGSPIQTVNLPYDIRLTDNDGLSLDIFAGVIILSRGETRA